VISGDESETTVTATGVRLRGDLLPFINAIVQRYATLAGELHESFQWRLAKLRCPAHRNFILTEQLEGYKFRGFMRNEFRGN
jgi:hypothetical protein